MDLNRALTRAKRIEDALRERAFLPIGETINGVEVLQFSLRHLTILFEIRSPFLYGGGIREIEDVGLFLWIVSPHYDPKEQPYSLVWYRRWWRNLWRQRIPTVREVFMWELVQHRKWHLFYRAIDRYIARAFMDRPPTSTGNKRIAASFAASMIHRIAAVYGWTDEIILDSPLARLFQYMNWIASTNNPDRPQFHPFQDRIKKRAMQ